MNFIEMLLSDKLKDINATLDLFGSDRKVLQIACQDLTNYLRFHWNLVGKEANECDIVEKLEELFNENPNELEEFLEIWAKTWYRKWKERVKLLIGNGYSRRWDKVTKILNKAEPVWRRLSNRQEMQEVVTATLIRNGEICGTSILAENLLKMELGKNRKNHASKEEQIINVVNNTLRKAKELARSRGPLIYVKIDKNYYQLSQ
ncbi:hypothetical protein CW707_04900 [Candidatus Bathyarchaeota archaeon]|nr:MAG: hypothetical protein CW667_03240 [Candidatus Bathyarchaeota archaeon]RJS80770.1 MAG: hypothetical protein CW707_04900 [Candidatus Bathyarchaeota archaeon]RLI16120.1 MAG: hypothetical protein DRO44_05605 [Candidatus Bathyarchaeota archaeon]HDD70187.1 hypothetical protein [Candidatus Bathyarchaeota archaeon]